MTILSMLILSITITASGDSGGPWPYFGHDLSSSRRSPYDTSHVDGAVKWVHNATLPQPRAAMQSPVIDRNGNIYISSNSVLHALNSKGEVLWESTTPEVFISSSPALGPDGTVYIGGEEGIFYAYNPRNGDILWTLDAGSRILSDPVVNSRNEIFFGTDDGVFFAVDGNQRRVLWNFTVKQPQDGRNADIVSSPAIANDGTIYFGSYNGYLYSLDEDGNLLWEEWLGQEGIISSPSIANDGTIYVGFIDGLYAFNPDGSLKWTFQLEDPITGELYGVMGSAAIDRDGTIYFGSYESTMSGGVLVPQGSIYALHPNGELKWRVVTDGAFAYSSPAIGGDGTIYIGSTHDTFFYAINSDGSLKWFFDTGSSMDFSSPAIGMDGTVYVGNNRGSIYAFTGEPRESEMNWLVIGAVVCIVACVALGTIYTKKRNKD